MMSIQISKKLWRHLEELFPEGMTWEEILVSLLKKSSMPLPPATLKEIRESCKHPNTEIKTGLLPNPEEVWRWCLDCQLLVEKVR